MSLCVTPCASPSHRPTPQAPQNVPIWHGGGPTRSESSGDPGTALAREPVAVQPAPARAGRLLQGYIELANVGLQTELVELQQAENDAVVIRCALATQGILTVPRAPVQPAAR